MAKAIANTPDPGSQGKGAGVGAMTDMPEGEIGENDILSNRDKKQHTDERGLDGKRVQSEQHGDESRREATNPLVLRRAAKRSLEGHSSLHERRASLATKARG